MDAELGAGAQERGGTAQIAATFWNRLEPRPRSPEIIDALAARVRDPLWMLARQWQVGEFAGEDAGSPAYVQIKSSTGPVLGWRPEGGGAMEPVEGPLEELVENEAFTADLATRIEFGLMFERLLVGEGLDGAVLQAILAAFRIAHPVSFAGVTDTDRGGTRLAEVAAGRAIDGIAVIGSPMPNDVTVNANAVQVGNAVAALTADAAATLGPVGASDAPAWRREQLEYRVEVAVRHPSNGPLLLRADPDRDAAFEWFTFDALSQGDAGVANPAPGGPAAESTSLVPTFVSFRGMPNHRWWDFERGMTDFGAITPDRRDMAKLVLMDFMLIHGNDYFLIPFDQKVGTVCRVDALLVHDVFGGITLVERADRNAAEPGRRWTLFSLSDADADGQPSDLFFLPPTAGAHSLAGSALEDVRFVRDEQANHVWALEHCAEGVDGLPLLGHERHIAEAAKEPAATPPASASPLTYRLQTYVPWHWFPMVPIMIDPLSGATALEQGRMVRPDGRVPAPIGRLLSTDAEPYRIREEAVPRVGVRIVREPVRSRWVLGSTHLWIARRKLVGRGEGSSGLRYDMGEASTPP
ncbi:hypothetical protein ACQ86D_00130 [Streptomyces galilaeus]